MKKRKLIFLLPIAAMALGACGKKDDGGSSDPGEQEHEEVTLAIISKANFELEVEATKQLEAELKGATGDLAWSSSAVAVATVDATGKVTAVAPGEATITVKFGEKEDSVVVTVKAKQEETEYGSVENPITVAAAKAIIDAECDASDKLTKQAIVVKGFVSKIIKEYSYTEGPSFEFNLSDGTNEVYVYRCLATAEAKANLSVGSEVVVKAFAKNYKGTKEMCDNGDTKSQFVSIAASTKALASIESVAGPAEVTQNATILTDSVNVVVVYEDGFKGTVHPDSIDVDTSVGGEVTATAHVGELTKTFTVTVIAPKENKFAEAYAAAKALSSGETAEFYFEGVVVGTRGDDTFVQYEGYGIDVYKSPVAVSVGDKIGVTSTLQNYNGMPETKTIKSVEALGKASVPEAVKITSKTVHEGLNINVLCEIEAQIKDLPAFANSDYTFVVSIGSDDFNVFVKKAIYSNFKTVFDTLSVGDDIKLSNAITGIYKTNIQIGVAATSTLEKIVHAVTDVSLDKETLSMEEGSTPQTLVATVAPENATNKSVTWESSDPAVATVENGLVTAVAQGEATITVKTVDGEFTDECVVTVTAATKTMTGISVEGPTKVEYTEGELLDLTGLVVTAHYDNESTEVLTAGYTTSIENGAALTTADTSFTVTYGTFISDPIALTVNEKGPIVAQGTYTIHHTKGDVTYYLSSNLGTSNQPLVTTEASEAVVFDFVLKADTKDTYTIKVHDENKYLAIGADNNNGIRFSSSAFEWKITEGSRDAGAFDISGVYASKTRFLTLYATTDFRCYESATHNNRQENTDLSAVVVKSVSSISIKEEPTKKTYYVGEAFDPAGLVITVHYTDGSSEDITTGFTYEGSTGFQKAVESRTVTITYKTKTCNVQGVAVLEDDRTITAIKFAQGCDMTKKTYEVDDEWDPAGLKVIAVRSDESEFELKAEDVTFTYDQTTEVAAESLTLNVTAHYQVDDQTTLDSAAKTISVVVKEKEAGEKVVIDGTNLTSTATTANTDVDCGGIICTMSAGAKQQSSSGENKFSEKAILIGKNGAYIFNKNAIPGKITKFEIYVNKGASAKVTFGIVFSDSPISEYSTGDHTATFGNGSSLGLDQVYDASDKLTDNCQYFWYQVTNANNSQVQFRITYTPNA